jgi:hypothetical protein
MVLPAEAAEFGEVYRMRARDTKAESADPPPCWDGVLGFDRPLCPDLASELAAVIRTVGIHA